ncbi:MAG: TonB-dependent receptor [Acidobacteria bacterium]|nr:TonB-dependent receptor [Acidobacteriota bacterium]
MKKLLSFLSVFLMGNLLFAQQKHGALMGIVTYQNEPLVGVVATLEGPNLIGKSSSVSNEKGRFRFNLVPPGGDYKVTLTLAGFRTLVRDHLSVNLGQVTELELEMNTDSVSEVLVVSGESPLIDATTNQISRNFSTELIGKLTNDRQMQMVMAMTPGAIEDNNPSMLGGASTDNLYMVDGADNTDPLTKTWSTALNFDAVEEVQVITGGVSAEYGRNQGAVVNLATKSGGNSFAGNLRFIASDIDWNSEDDGKPFDEATKYTTESRFAGTLGGPIIKDKFWFFTAYETRGKEKQTFHYATLEDYLSRDAGRQTSRVPKYEGHYFNVKLTYQPTPDHTIQANYNEDPIEFPLYNYLNSSNYGNGDNITREQGGDNLLLDWNWIITPNVITSLKYQRKDSPLNNRANYHSTVLEPVQEYNASFGTFYTETSAPTSDYYSAREYDSYNFSLNLFFESGWGFHDIKMGGEVRDAQYGSISPAWAGGFRMRWLASSGIGRMRIYDDPRSWVLTNEDYQALFIQDTWSVNDKLTLTLGLRSDHLSLANVDNVEVVNLKFGDTLAPRLGFAYKINQDSFHGSFSQYYDAIGDWIVRNNAPNQLYYADEYQLNLRMSELEAMGLAPWINPNDWLQINPQDHPDLWTYRTQYTFGSDGTADILGTIDPAYMQEYTLGYEKQMGSRYAVGLNYYNRTWKNAYEDEDFDQDGQWAFQTYKGTWRKYEALILTAQRQFTGTGLQFFTSYTYSKTRGISASDNSTAYLDSPYDVFNWYGRTLDYPTQIKFNGSYTFDFGLNVGLNYQFFSGSVWTPTISVENQIPGGVNEGGTATPLAETRGSRRLPNTQRTDLHVEYGLNLFNGKLKPSIYADVFNLLNQRYAINVNSDMGDGHYEYGPGNEPGTQGYIDYVTTHAPVLDDPNSRFGEYTQYTFPRSFFLGINLQF